MAISIIDNFTVNTTKNIDSRLGPYATANEATGSIPTLLRYVSMTVTVTGSGTPVEYWFSPTTASTDFVIKTPVTNNVNNYILTATGGSTINGESQLTFDGTTLSANGVSFQQGLSTTATGLSSHAQGRETVTLGSYSHAEGRSTSASGDYQHVQGQYNITSSVQGAFILGNGTSNANRSNLIFAAGTSVDISGSLNILGSINQNGAPVKPYKVFTALLTQNGTSNIVPLISGPLVVGVTYKITTSYTDDDFTNVGGPLITYDDEYNDTYFVATGTTPNTWGSIAPTELEYDEGAPEVIVLENTIGNIWFTYEDIGSYFIYSDGLFSPQSKSCIVYSGTTSDDGGPTMYFVYASIADSTFAKIFVSDPTDSSEDSALGNYLIEIRVYN